MIIFEETGFPILISELALFLGLLMFMFLRSPPSKSMGLVIFF